MKKIFLPIIILLSSLLLFDVVKAETQSYSNLYFGYYENQCGTKSYKYLYPNNTALLGGVCGMGASPTRVTRFDFSLTSNFVANTLYHVRFKISLPRNDSEFTFNTNNLQDYLLVTGKNWQTNNIKSYSVSTGYENGGLFFVDAYVMFNASSDLLTIGFRNTDYAENTASHVFMFDYSIDGIEIGPIFADLEYTNDPTADLLNKLNQNQNITNEKLDDLNQTQNDIKDSLNNSDTTGANNAANSFFNNFQDNDFGLSSIITAPLRAINAMLSDTCVSPSATYKGQTFSFPCGSMLWDREGGQDFRNFINIIYGGFLAYFVIRAFFLDIEKLKNPNNDKVEVQKL